MNNDSSSTPEEILVSERRKAFLRQNGIDPDQQQIAAHTINSIATALAQKIDGIILSYFRLWVPQLAAVPAEKLQHEFAAQFKGALAIIDSTSDPVSGWRCNKYVIAYELRNDVRKYGFEIMFRVLPAGNANGLLRLEVEHKQIPVPAGVTISRPI